MTFSFISTHHLSLFFKQLFSSLSIIYTYFEVIKNWQLFKKQLKKWKIYFSLYLLIDVYNFLNLATILLNLFEKSFSKIKSNMMRKYFYLYFLKKRKRLKIDRNSKSIIRSHNILYEPLCFDNEENRDSLLTNRQITLSIECVWKKK